MENKPVLMKCGCVAQGVCSSMGGIDFKPPIPCCVVHDCLEPAESEPDLTRRLARCNQCGTKRPSSFMLPFFEYQGDASTADRAIVKERNELLRTGWKAGYSGQTGPKAFPKEQSDRLNKLNALIRATATGDAFYCGCRGWD